MVDEARGYLVRQFETLGGQAVRDVVAWANVELTKSAAEIGYARFLYAVTEQHAPPR